MDRNTALKIWEQYYGTKDEAYDYASHLIKKYEYQNRSSEYGWAIDYKRPLTFGGKNVPDNMIPTSLEVIRKRNGKLNFTIGNLSYEIRKGKKFGLYYIFDVTDKNAPISVEPDVDNQDPEYNKKRLLRSENKESKPTFDLSSPLKKKEYNFITSQNDKKDEHYVDCTPFFAAGSGRNDAGRLRKEGHPARSHRHPGPDGSAGDAGTHGHAGNFAGHGHGDQQRHQGCPPGD